MTKQESQQIEDLMKAIRDQTMAFDNFAKNTNDKIAELSVQVKNQPFNLEVDFNHAMKSAIVSAAEKFLSDSYNSPFKKLIEKAVNRNEDFLVNLFDESINELDKLALKEEMKNRIIRSYVSQCVNASGGMIDKYFNHLKQDAVFRAKLAVALDKVVTDLIQE